MTGEFSPLDGKRKKKLGPVVIINRGGVMSPGGKPINHLYVRPPETENPEKVSPDVVPLAVDQVSKHLDKLANDPDEVT